MYTCNRSVIILLSVALPLCVSFINVSALGNRAGSDDFKSCVSGGMAETRQGQCCAYGLVCKCILVWVHYVLYEDYPRLIILGGTEITNGLFFFFFFFIMEDQHKINALYLFSFLFNYVRIAPWCPLVIFLLCFKG